MGKAAIKLEFNQDELVGSRGQVVADHHQSLCEHGYSKGQQSQSNNDNCLSHTDQCWLDDYVALELKQISKQLKPSLIGVSGKAPSLVNRKPDLNSYNTVTNSQDWSSSQTQSPLNEGVAGSP